MQTHVRLKPEIQNCDRFVWCHKNILFISEVFVNIISFHGMWVAVGMRKFFGFFKSSLKETLIRLKNIF